MLLMKWMVLAPITKIKSLSLVAYKMSNESDANLFKLYVQLQNLMNQHIVIDCTIKDISVSESELDLESLEASACAIISICQEIEQELSPGKKCSCV